VKRVAHLFLDLVINAVDLLPGFIKLQARAQHLDA